MFIFKLLLVYDFVFIICYCIFFFLLRDFFCWFCIEFVVKGMFVYVGKVIVVSGIFVDFVNGGDCIVV